MWNVNFAELDTEFDRYFFAIALKAALEDQLALARELRIRDVVMECKARLQGFVIPPHPTQPHKK